MMKVSQNVILVFLLLMGLSAFAAPPQTLQDVYEDDPSEFIEEDSESSAEEVSPDEGSSETDEGSIDESFEPEGADFE